MPMEDNDLLTTYRVQLKKNFLTTHQSGGSMPCQWIDQQQFDKISVESNIENQHQFTIAETNRFNNTRLCSSHNL